MLRDDDTLEGFLDFGVACDEFFIANDHRSLVLREGAVEGGKIARGVRLALLIAPASRVALFRDVVKLVRLL